MTINFSSSFTEEILKYIKEHNILYRLTLIIYEKF